MNLTIVDWAAVSLIGLSAVYRAPMDLLAVDLPLGDLVNLYDLNLIAVRLMGLAVVDLAAS